MPVLFQRKNKKEITEAIKSLKNAHYMNNLFTYRIVYILFFSL